MVVRPAPPFLALPKGRSLPLDRPRIMGILNVTPDSFSDGGEHPDIAAAVAHARHMIAQGADVIDVGGESTRPGSQPVDADEQIRRTAGVISKLAQDSSGLLVSIDTSRSAVAQAAIAAGASMINDVTAGRGDSAMFALAARAGTPIVLMHMQGQPVTMQQQPTYGDVVAEVRAFLLERAAAAEAAGVKRGAIVLDPGIGFGKTRDHNLALLGAIDQFVATGYPIMLGTSRKRFMGAICLAPDGTAPAPRELVGATCATTALGVAAGAHIFRVHDVPANRQAADVAHAIRLAR